MSDDLERLARNDLRLMENGTYSYANWKNLAEGVLDLVDEVKSLRKVAELAECLLINQPRLGPDAAKHNAKLLAEALREWKGI